MIRLPRRDPSSRRVPLSAFGVALLIGGSATAMTSCAVGPGCSTNYTAPTGSAAGAGAPVAAATSPADPQDPLRVDPGAAPALARPAAAMRTTSATVTLVTGDKVRVDAGPGGQTATPTIAPAAGAQATGSPGFVRFSWGGDQYLVPDAAVPYIGSTLDLRLFDVSYLVRAGLDDAHAKKMPLQVSGDAAALPGLHSTGRSAGAESATLTKTQTPAVGRLLASAWRSGAPSTTLGRLGTVTLAQPQGAPALPTLPAGPTALPTASGGHGPHWHTVTLKFIGSDGQPGTGIGWLQNLGDARLGTYLVNSDNPSDGIPPVKGATGPVSYSVPDGDYSIEVSVLTPHAGTANGTDAALVVLPDLAVHGDQTVVLDARTANPFQSEVDPAVNAPVRVDEIDMWRASTTGGGCGGGAGGGQSMGLVSAVGAGYAASVIGATPTAKVTAGGLGFAAETLLHVGNGPDPSPDPRYFLVFPSQGAIPKSLRYTVPAADLTTVRSHVYDRLDPGCTGDAPELWPNVYYPWGGMDELRVGSSGLPVDIDHVPPGDHTDYWYASDPALASFESATLYGDNSQTCFDGGIRFGERRAVHAGGQIDETWHKGPEVPSSAAVPTIGYFDSPPFPTSQQGIASAVAPATRQDDNGMLYLLRGGDSDASHFMDDASTYSLSFYRDGQQVINAPFVPLLDGAQTAPFRLDLPMAHGAATYKLDWAMMRYFTSADVSATTDTVWTFHSGPSDPAAAMPNGEKCAPDTTRPCSFLPLLFLHYDLPLDFQSQAPAGKPLTITFGASGQQGAPAPKDVTATVSESFDAGQTWTTPVAATAQGNTFSATVDQPATSGPVSLKVHAVDADGNAIDQTMTTAYGLTSGGE